MSENRTWVVMREKDGYKCALCGYEERDESRRAITPVVELATPQNGATHTVEVCDACLRQVMLPRCAEPFGVVTHPREGSHV